jgi:hypothetical protein
VITWRSRPSHQFIEALSGGAWFDEIALAAEKGVSHCGDLPWRSQDNELWRSLGSHYGSRWRDKCPKAWHPHGEWRTRRWRPLGHVGGANGWITERTVPPSSSAARSFTRGSLSVFNQAWIATLARIRTQGRWRRGALHLWLYLVHCTIAAPFSRPDRAHLGAICSKFRVVTRPTLCIKVVLQQTSFNFITEVLVKHPLNRAPHGPKVDPIHCFLWTSQSLSLTARLQTYLSLISVQY